MATRAAKKRTTHPLGKRSRKSQEVAWNQRPGGPTIRNLPGEAGQRSIAKHERTESPLQAPDKVGHTKRNPLVRTRKTGRNKGGSSVEQGKSVGRRDVSSIRQQNKITRGKV